MHFLPFAWFGDFYRIFFEVDACDQNPSVNQRHSLKNYYGVELDLVLSDPKFARGPSSDDLFNELLSYRISEVPESKLSKHNW